jgi:thioredoxin-dependent peroxiredoxin
MAEAYGVTGPGQNFAKRWTFFIDKEGTIRHIEKAVKADSHGGDVVAKLKDLGVATK